MKKTVKTIGYIAACLVFSIALSGCSKKPTVSNTNNKIVVWSFENEDVWKSVKTSFEQKYQGYELVYKKQTLDNDYETRALNAMMSGDGPDIWSIPNDWVYRHKEKLSQMPKEMASKYNLDEEFVPVVKQSVYFDNAIYGLTPSAEPLMIYYNPKVISEAWPRIIQKNPNLKSAEEDRIKNILFNMPRSWTDFTEVVKMLTLKEGDNIKISAAAIGTESLEASTDLLYLLMLQNETRIISEDLTTATLNLPVETASNSSNTPGKNALDFYTSFSDPSSPNYTWNNQLGNELDAFLAGKVAMIFGYNSTQNEISQRNPDFSYKKAYIPQVTSEGDKFVDYARFNALTVSKLSKNTTLCWGVINDIIVSYSDYFNSSERMYTSKKSSIGETERTLSYRVPGNPERLALAGSKTILKGRYPEEFDRNINNMILSVNKKILDSNSAINQAANNITTLLRKTSW